MKTFEEMAKTYFAKPTLLERITELEPSCYGDIELIVKQEVLKQEQAIKQFILSRIATLKAEHKKMIAVYPTLSDSMKTVKSRRMQAIEKAIIELKFLMLKTNGKLKRDLSYPRS